MRRKDREMDKNFGYYVIDKSQFGSLATYTTNFGLLNLPLSIIRKDDILYFHSSKVGEKTEFFKSNPSVKITFITDIKIPENYTQDELNIFKVDANKSSELIKNVFTTEFASSIVDGKIEIVNNNLEKIEAMKSICEKYTPSKMDFFDTAINSGLKLINIYKIPIYKVSSKRKKYDINGIEMKFMREK